MATPLYFHDEIGERSRWAAAAAAASRPDPRRAPVKGAMCNLYSLRTGPADLRRAFGAAGDRTGDLPPLPAIFPDQMAPVVRNAPAGRELRPWTGVRGTKCDNPERAARRHHLFSSLTTEANGVVGAVHPKAMPVLLTTPEEWAAWLEAPVDEALRLQRPLPDAAVREVAWGTRADGPSDDGAA